MTAWHGSRRRGDWSFVWVAGGVLLWPTARAQAHTTFPGMGEYASGFLHPLTTPAHLLILLALGLSLAQQAPLRLKEPVAVFAAAAAAGLLLTAATRLGGIPLPALVALGLCVGASVAVGASIPLRVRASACGVGALVLGLDSGVDPGTPGWSAVKILFATWASLTLCLVNVSFYVSLLPAARWAQIGVRVLGSWIVAIAFLLLAFALRR